MSKTAMREITRAAVTAGSASCEPVASAVSFTRHALSRMASRGIELDTCQHARLGDAVRSLAGKGGRQALILLDQIALVVSVEHCRIITVVGRQALREHIFTNIDCAIFA